MPSPSPTAAASHTGDWPAAEEGLDNLAVEPGEKATSAAEVPLQVTLEAQDAEMAADAKYVKMERTVWDCAFLLGVRLLHLAYGVFVFCFRRPSL